MLSIISRRDKNYSRHNIIKNVLSSMKVRRDIYLLLPFSKKTFVSLLLKRKTVINDFFISDYDTYVNDRKKGSKLHPSAIYKFALDWLNFKFSPYLISDTQNHFNHWESIFGTFRGKHLVFPVLADNSIYYPRQKQSQDTPNSILFFGYFIPLHGIDIILKALKICESRGIAFSAELIGEGQTLNDMLLLADKLALTQVSFTRSLIPEQELAERICDSDIVLGIFGESSKAKSVIPNKVYQALACQKPVITQDSSAVREFFSDQHLCLVKRDPLALADAIEDLLADKNRAASLAKSGNEAYKQLYSQSIESLKLFIFNIDREIS